MSWRTNRMTGCPFRRAEPSYIQGVDRIAADELELWILHGPNAGRLSYQQGIPIIKNLATKKARGIYDHEKAVKLYMYFVEAGARDYNEYHSSTVGVGIFNKSTREVVARNLTKMFEEEYALGNYHDLLPKKYQKERMKMASETTAEELHK